MKSFTLVFSTMLCVATTFPAFAGSSPFPKDAIILAQADVTFGPNGVRIGERDRDRDHVRYRDHDRGRDHDRLRARLSDRDSDRGCRTVTVEGRGETRTTRRCD